MKKFLLALCVLASSLAFGQGSIYNDILLGQNVPSIPGGTVLVCTSSATGTPCSPTASVYTDAALTHLIANSTVTADSRGNFSFYAAPGLYMLQVSSPTTSTVSYIVTVPSIFSNTVTLPMSPANGGTGANNTVGSAGHVLRSNGTDYVDASLGITDLNGITVSGNSGRVAEGSGTFTNGDALEFDSNANIIDTGVLFSHLALTTVGLSQFASTTSAQLRGVLSDPTGTGSAVFATSPTLVTPNIGAATGTSLNLGATGTLSTTAQSGTGSLCMTTNCAMTTPNLGTPSAETLTNATGLPVAGVVAGTANQCHITNPTPASAWGTCSVVVAQYDQTGLTANLGSTLLYAVPSSGAGMYQLSCWIIITTAAGSSSTSPFCSVVVTEEETSVSTNISIVGTSTNNTAGSPQCSQTQSCTVVVRAKASTNMNVSTSSYASNPASAMTYSIHVKVVYLGS